MSISRYRFVCHSGSIAVSDTQQTVTTCRSTLSCVGLTTVAAASLKSQSATTTLLTTTKHRSSGLSSSHSQLLTSWFVVAQPSSIPTSFTMCCLFSTCATNSTQGPFAARWFGLVGTGCRALMLGCRVRVAAAVASIERSVIHAPSWPTANR